ncbi:MAG TPA: efflux RND transporter periplasmic adaptor subunit [Polyangia bacterium]|jgi:Cu(I)/Ag(I) efflux system membrane fusion protein|nr:efflux RND transporter periplasmic adaptor subunit [Polyangia bacterium]
MSTVKSLDEQTPADPPSTPQGPPRGVATMSIVRWVLVLLAALVAAGSILSYAGVHIGGANRGSSASSVRLYHCPMHPSVVQDHPGECPICGMTLVLGPAATVKTPEATKSGAPAAEPPRSGVPGLAPVEFTPERIQLIGMRTATVKRDVVGGELRAVGVVGANERGLAQINTRFAGWIQKLLVSETGVRVRRGQVLATIYSPDVLRAQQEMLVARGWNTPGAPDVKASHEHDAFAAGLDANARRRLELLGISGQEIDEVLHSGKAIEAIAIRSPVDGYVVAKNAVVGVAVQPGTVLFEVADLSQVWVTAEIYEQDVSRIHVGQKARLELASFAGETHLGKVQFISPILDSGSRTLRVRLEFKNRSDRDGPRLKPGMYGNVYLDLPRTTGLMVPEEAVVDTGETHYLFVATPGGHFEPRVVKVGAHLKGQVEILSGVSEGETVVTTGNFLIDSESRLRAAIEGQTSGQTSGGAPVDQSSSCSTDFDGQKYPEKVQSCRACEIQHRGMGTMVDDCKKTIPKPWR